MRRAERGFTLIEVLIALVVFAIVAIGALAALGATTASGFLGTFPTSFTTVRAARDYTTAAVYLQSFQEFVASLPSASVTPVSQTVVPPGSSMPFGAPPPPPESELKWTQLDICVERWYWNGTKYTDPDPNGCSTTNNPGDYITLVRSTLTWTFKGQPRPPLMVNRFIP